METPTTISGDLIAVINSLAQQIEALREKVSPEYRLLDDAAASVRFGISIRKIAELRLSAQGPRAAVDGKDAKVSEAEWIAFFKRQEKARGVRQ